MRLLKAVWNWKVRTKGLGLEAWDWWLDTEGLGLKASNWNEWLEMNGCNWRVLIKGLQQKGCHWLVANKILWLKICNWRLLETDWERLKLKGRNRGCNPKLGNEGKSLQLKGRNCKVRTEWLPLKVCNWRLETESLRLKTNGT